MNKWILFIICLGCYWTAQAHQPDIATTMLVEQSDNKWVLQIRASLTAFQYEIKTHYSDTPYATPQEFEQLVTKYVKENLVLIFDQKDTVTFGQSYVKLGHETNVVFEVLGVPALFKSIEVKNASFRDIHKNQNGFIILKKGFSKAQFILNDENQHTAKIVADDATFKLATVNAGIAAPLGRLLVIGILTLVFGVGYALWFNSKRKRVAEDDKAFFKAADNIAARDGLRNVGWRD